MQSYDAVIPNDPCDTDAGPNEFQNFPLLNSATSGGTTISIEGTLNSAPDATFLLQFFANATCDSSGFGEGERLIGTINVMTDANCQTNFKVSFPVAISPGQVITATATDELGNTSEFSQCVVVRESPFTICVQDDSNGNILKINTTTGEYQLTNCTGVIAGGIGRLTRMGSTITLQHSAGDRRVYAKIDTSAKKATASIQMLSLGRTFTITDRNITDNTCACR